MAEVFLIAGITLGLTVGSLLGFRRRRTRRARLDRQIKRERQCALEALERIRLMNERSGSELVTPAGIRALRDRGQLVANPRRDPVWARPRRPHFPR